MEVAQLIAMVIALGLMYCIGLVRGKNLNRADPDVVADLTQKLKADTDALRAATRPFDAPVPVGERFTYLGLDMLCLGHTVYGGGISVPGIRAEYVAADGVLRTWCFVGPDMEGLRAELQRERVLDWVTPQ